ncbi:hypothetical protein [Mycoavidus sp. SF9855]|uniref:hypothetical protein n=1 Tax=Mycoavidus sp. SF9855 TaxID=2968475 RepID=UPI00211C034E|nr:hypothetical protein [Mycoavidus sp. SF9855]UUM21168.1 hypothetical protein NQD60_06870 [Mycoavidus sp. SF9855]
MKHLAVALAAVCLVAGFFLYGKEVGKAEIYAAWTRDKLAQSEAARQKEAALQIAKQAVEKQFYEYKQANERTVASLDADNRRLLDTIACYRTASESTINTGGFHGDAASGWKFFGQCTERHAEMAKQADEINIIAHGLQEYLRVVFLPANDWK